jgi:NAD(P)-dependent dehydrogenase (short-subunit alcohol dehydrogenase family)
LLARAGPDSLQRRKGKNHRQLNNGGKSMSSFAGKTAVIAGGARGIGEKVAEDIVARGGNVVIGDMNTDLGEALSSRLGATKAKFIKLDVSRSADCERAVEAARSAFDGADFLVNCAIVMSAKSLIDLSEGEWHKTLDVGLTGTFLMARTFAADLVGEKKTGAIVNISSIGGQHPYGGAGAYSAVKAGITLLTEQMALEWAQYGIRVNAVAPGTIETPLTAYLKEPDIRESRREAVPLGRIGQPADISNGILYLLSDAASWVTATTLTVDGGVSRSLFNHMKGRKWS